MSPAPLQGRQRQGGTERTPTTPPPLRLANAIQHKSKQGRSFSQTVFSGHGHKRRMLQVAGGVVDKVVVVVGSGRRPCVGSNSTKYGLEPLPFVEWLKVSYMSP
ncbi:hypothetical protein E2C01_054880 [Portunus trituberculatus]|uniref:Uncharacterized protein n=1 Tax=Portunus trituberculatus TaxID=210409 RepID=A0A5B7GT88_PORTR|nr:hypothetical protein [Portunus trituberculatus]